MVGEVVVHPAVEIIVVKGKPERDSVIDWHIPSRIAGVAAAMFKLIAGASFEGIDVTGLTCEYADRTEACIFAKEGGLRSLDELHPVKVEHGRRIEAPFTHECTVHRQRFRKLEGL